MKEDTMLPFSALGADITIELVNVGDLAFHKELHKTPDIGPFLKYYGTENLLMACAAHFPVCFKREKGEGTETLLVARHWAYTCFVSHGILRFPAIVVRDESAMKAFLSVDRQEIADLQALFDSNAARTTEKHSKSSTTITRRAAREAEQTCPVCSGALRVFSLSKNPEFVSFEFRDASKLDSLCRTIREEIGIHESEGEKAPLIFLNSLLETPDLYDKFKIIEPEKPFSDRIRELIGKTGHYRGKDYDNLSRMERQHLKLLNRLIMEEAYGQYLPKLNERARRDPKAHYIACENRSNSLVRCAFYAALSDIEMELFRKNELPTRKWITSEEEKCPKCGSSMMRRILHTDRGEKIGKRCKNSKHSLYARCVKEEQA